MRAMKKRTFLAGAAVVLAAGASVTGALGFGADQRAELVIPSAAPPQQTLQDLQGSMSALKNARTAQDALSARAGQAFSGLANSDPRVSPGDTARSIRLINTPFAGSVYIVPDSDGIYTLVADAYAASTRLMVSASHPINFGGGDPDALGSGQPGYLLGVASDQVAGIDVIANGRASKATLQGNGWFWQAPDGNVAINSVQVLAHLKNGSTVSAP